MTDYKNGKIYAIKSHLTDKIYIGSTANPLNERFNTHTTAYKANRLSCSSKEILQYDDAYIELLENYPCESRSELERREGEVITTTANHVNIKIAGRTQQEWNEANRDKLNIQSRRNYQVNRDKVLAQARAKYQANRETKRLKYQANREAILTKAKLRYQAKKAVNVIVISEDV